MSKHKALAPADIPVDVFDIRQITDGATVISAHRGVMNEEVVEIWIDDPQADDENAGTVVANMQLDRKSALLFAEQILVALRS